MPQPLECRTHRRLHLSHPSVAHAAGAAEATQLFGGGLQGNSGLCHVGAVEAVEAIDTHDAELLAGGLGLASDHSKKAVR